MVHGSPLIAMLSPKCVVVICMVTKITCFVIHFFVVYKLLLQDKVTGKWGMQSGMVPIA